MAFFQVSLEPRQSRCGCSRSADQYYDHNCIMNTPFHANEAPQLIWGQTYQYRERIILQFITSWKLHDSLLVHIGKAILSDHGNFHPPYNWESYCCSKLKNPLTPCSTHFLASKMPLVHEDQQKWRKQIAIFQSHQTVEISQMQVFIGNHFS